MSPAVIRSTLVDQNLSIPCSYSCMCLVLYIVIISAGVHEYDVCVRKSQPSYGVLLWITISVWLIMLITCTCIWFFIYDIHVWRYRVLLFLIQLYTHYTSSQNMILKFKKIKGKYYTFHIAVKFDVINIQYNTIQYFYFHKNGPTWGMTRTLTTSQYNMQVKIFY